MAYEFSESDLQRIIKLPAWIQTLKDKYPVSVVNTADTWEEQPLPEDYIPKEVEIFMVMMLTIQIYLSEMGNFISLA